jgi:outer membrane protein TolC
MQLRSTNGLFDELKRMAQSRVAMKWIGIWLVAIMAGVSALAQESNAPVAVVETNLPSAPDQVYAALTNTLATENSTPGVTREMSLQECIDLTLQHNIELQIDRYIPGIARYNLKAAYSAYDPTAFFSGLHSHSESGPAFLGTNIIGGTLSDADSFNTSLSGLSPWGTTYRFFGNTSDTIQNNGFLLRRNAGAQAGVNLTQPLLKNFWIDSSRLLIRVDKNRLKYDQYVLQLDLMNTITALEQVYYDLIYTRENVLVQEKAAEQTDQLVAENKKKLEVGALAELDLAAAEAQAAQNRAAIITAKSLLGTQERKLKLYITDDIAKWADVTIVPAGPLTAPKQDFNRQNSWRKALAQRPDYQEAKLDAEQAGIQLKYDYNQLFPEVDVIGSFGYNGSGTVFSGALYDVQQQNRPFYTFGGQISLPLANVGPRNLYKGAKLSMQQYVLLVKQKERDILISVDNDIGTLQADYDSVQATHAQRLYEEQALDAEQKKLANGKSTTYQVLLVQRDLTAARGAEIQALDTYNKGLSQLSLDEGTTLERLNIDLQVK